MSRAPSTHEALTVPSVSVVAARAATVPSPELTVQVDLKKGANTLAFSSQELPSFDGTTLISDTFPDVLLRSKEGWAKVEWHFFASSRSDSLGPTKELMDALSANGIGWVIHLP